eukprot:2756-Heterococcus_DN1.PRE.1
MAGRGRGGRGRGRGGGMRGYAAAAGGDECACAMNMPLLEAMEELEAGHIRDSDTNKRAVVAKAIKSIVLVPFPITTHEEAMSLDGVGPYLAGKMMRVLRANGAPANGAPEAAAATAAPAPKQTGKVNNAAFSDALLRDNRAISLNGNMAARLDEDGNNNNDGMSSQPPNTKKRKAAAAKSTNRETDDTNCPVTFAGGQWEAVLVLDSREMEVQAAQASMLQSGVECHVRSLPLGDMLWVARKRGYASGTPGSEVLLGYIVERKTAA